MTSNRYPRLSDFVFEMDLASWTSDIGAEDLKKAIESIESGKVLYAPSLAFKIKELEQQAVSQVTNTISYDPHTGKAKGISTSSNDYECLQNLFERFSREAHAFVSNILPFYKQKLIWGPTSFRQDDVSLHIDATSSNPNGGKRILRVYSNIGPKTQEWRLGEPFTDIAKRYLPKVSPQIPGSSFLMHTLGLTKERRTAYDHIMLNIHEKMKADKGYQDHVPQIRMSFPTESTWIMMSDSTSHAAMPGQQVLEQTFYLNPQDMMNPKLSPLYILERITGKSLT